MKNSYFRHILMVKDDYLSVKPKLEWAYEYGQLSCEPKISSGVLKFFTTVKLNL